MRQDIIILQIEGFYLLGQWRVSHNFASEEARKEGCLPL